MSDIDIDEVNDFFDEGFGNADDEAIEVPTDGEILKKAAEGDDTKVRKKRVILNPQPKLNEATLLGPKGLPALQEEFKDFKPNTDDPYGSLAIMMRKYEHWAHVMFPKMKFEDAMSRVENVGEKRPVKVYMMKARQGDPITDEDVHVAERKEPEIIHTQDNEEYGVITSRASSDDEDEVLFESSAKTIAATETSEDLGDDVNNKLSHANPVTSQQQEEISEDDMIPADDLALWEQQADELMKDFDYDAM